MVLYVFITIGILFLTFLYRIESHLIIKETIVNKYTRWRTLNQIVSTTERNNLRIAWVSFKIVMYTLYIAFLQYANKSVRKIDRKNYELTYVINGRLYKMIITPKLGPSPVLQISNDMEIDVTDHILPYMGPNYDWNGHKFSPQFFGYKSLTFELSDGTEHTYLNNTYIE
jgi:hypothetical protein